MATEINISLLVISASLIIQLLSAIVAFRLIAAGGKRGAPFLMLLAVFLMAFRRFISLYRFMNGHEIKTDLFAEAVGFAISVLLLAGLFHLRKLMRSVRTLSGLLPICASCKKIRDDKGYWMQIESYITKHSKAEFSHGICPECASKMYPHYPLVNEPRLKL